MPRSCNLKGKQYGDLVVVEQMPEKQDRYNLWRCKCNLCGGEILVNTKRLKEGTITNCGCIPKTTARNGPIAEDLARKKFGELIVLHRAENRKGRTCWVCLCSCGKLHTTTAHELKSGKCKSCGCKQYIKGRRFKDISMQRFGYLLALHTTSKRDKKGSIFWHCHCCKCGRELDITEDALVHGNYKSCGCLKAEIQKNIPAQLHLFDGTCLEWLKKRKHRSDNTSGFRGVHIRENGRFRVNIGFKGQRFNVGTYCSFDEAMQARLEIEELLHGEFIKAYHIWEDWKKADPICAEDNPLIFDVEKINGDYKVTTNMKDIFEEIRSKTFQFVTVRCFLV